MSCSGWRAVTWAVDFVPSANVSWMAFAPATTCRQVRMSPAWSMTTPVPRPSPPLPVPVGSWVSTRTSDGRIAS